MIVRWAHLPPRRKLGQRRGLGSAPGPRRGKRLGHIRKLLQYPDVKHTTRSPAQFAACLLSCLLALHFFSTPVAAGPVVVKADFESYAEGFGQHPFKDVASGIVLTAVGGFPDSTGQQTVDFANSLAPGQPADAPVFFQNNHFLAGNGFAPGDGWSLSGLYDVNIAFPPALAFSQISLDVGHTNLGTIAVTAFDASDNVVASDALTITSDQPQWSARTFTLAAPGGAPLITHAQVRVTGDIAVGYDNIQGIGESGGAAIPLPPAALSGLLALAAAGIVSRASAKKLASTALG